MEDNKSNVFGCFVSCPATIYDENQTEQQKIAEQKLLDQICEDFRSYIWDDKGINIPLKKLHWKNYGNDLELALFQFYINPIPYLLQHLKEIESYRKNEKAIGIPIIVNNENFFNKTEEGRYEFLKQSILQKMDLLTEVVKKRKLDTNMDLLKSDLEKVLQEFCIN